MKTVKQAAGDYWMNNQCGTKSIIESAFNAGVEYAQRWIDVNDELPSKSDKMVLVKIEGEINGVKWNEPVISWDELKASIGSH